MALPTASAGLWNPVRSNLDIGPLDGRPGDAMRRLFLANIARMRRVGVIKGLAIDILSVIRQMRSDRLWEILICWIGHLISVRLRHPPGLIEP